MILFILSFSDTLNLGLEKAIELGMKNNYSYLKRKIELEESIIEFLDATSEYTPNPSFSWQKEKTDTSYFYTSSFYLQQPILDISKILKLVSSLYGVNINKSIETERKKYLILDIKSKYIELLKAKFRLELAKKALKRAEEYKRLAEIKLKIGKATPLEKTRASLELTRAKIELLNAQNEEKIKKTQLLQTLGISKETPLKVYNIEVPESYEIIDYDSLENLFLKYNPLINAEKTSLASSKTGLFLNALSILPSVSYRWKYEYMGKENTYSPVDVINKGTYSKGISFSLIFSPFSYIFTNMKKEKENKKLEFQLKEKIIKLSRELKSYYLSLKAAKERIELSKQAKKEAEIVLKLAKRQFELGKITIIELLDAEKNYRDAKYELFSSLYDAFILKESINYITGMEVIK